MNNEIKNYSKLPKNYKDYNEISEQQSLKKKTNNNNFESIKEKLFSKIIKKIIRKIITFIKNFKNQILLNILIIIFLFYSIKFYLLSLEGCQGSRKRCLEGPEAIRFFHKLGLYLFFSVLLCSIITILSINGIIFKIYLLIELIIYIIFFIVYKGSDLDEHGSYNTMAFIFLFPFISFEIEIIYLFIKSIKNKNNKLKYFCIFILIFPFFYYIYGTNKGCKEWDYGLNNIKIKNNKNEDKCYIQKPKKCFIYLFDGFFDISLITGRKCKASKKEKTVLLSFLPKNVENLTEFAYPNTIKFPFGDMQNPKYLQNYIFKNIYNPKDKKAEYYTENPEIILKFDKNGKGKITMKITPNETLIKERRELSKKSKSKIKNILIMYIDAISRNHFKRKFPLTSKLIEKYLYKKNEKKKEKTKLNSFQFLKYHNFKAITQKNVIPMFYGNSDKELNQINILEQIKKNGFITAQSIDLCSLELYDLGRYYNEDVPWSKFDHENQVLFCDPNYNNPDDNFNPFNGPFSIIKRCLYGKEVNDYVFDYGYQFLNVYKNEKKFLRLGFQEAHESSLELIKYIDLKFRNFIQFFIDNFYDNDSIIFIISDHGNNMVSLHNLIKSNDYFIEKTLGTLFIFVPNNDIFDNYFENLYYNQQKLVTPYDIFFSLCYLIDVNDLGDKNKGQSLFQKINGLERSCENYVNDFDDREDCHCINY